MHSDAQGLHDDSLTLLAAFALLSRYSGQKDVLIGSPSANRNRTRLSELIGFFVNNLVLRILIDDGISFAICWRVRRLRWVLTNQDAPFDHLVRGAERSECGVFAAVSNDVYAQLSDG